MKKCFYSVLIIIFLSLFFVHNNWAVVAPVADTLAHTRLEIQYKGSPVNSAYFKDTLDIYCAPLDSGYKGGKMRFYADNRLIWETAYDSVFSEGSVRINRKIGEKIPFEEENDCLGYISWGTLIFLIIIIILMAVFTEKNYKKGFFSIIKDKSSSEKPTYSLSRTQMAFWTLIVIFSFFYVWLSKGEMIEFSEDVLILLGISAGTVAGANFIDKKDERKALQNNTKRHQDTESKGFFSDILSDETSLSIHRFQQVLFNIVIGGFFIYKVCESFVFPEIDSIIMILLGISNATYLTVKSTENNKL